MKFMNIYNFEWAPCKNVRNSIKPTNIIQLYGQYIYTSWQQNTQ